MSDEEHDCLDHLEFHQEQFSENMDCEVDGAIDRWTEQWWECMICRERLTDAELKKLWSKHEDESKIRPVEGV